MDRPGSSCVAAHGKRIAAITAGRNGFFELRKGIGVIDVTQIAPSLGINPIDLVIARALDAAGFPYLAWDAYGVCPQGHEEEVF